MISKAQVIRENDQHSTLINAVINRVGLDSVGDINSHGIDDGFSGFIYYTDTHSFAMRHRKAIVALLHETADLLGEDVVSMVAGFNCLNMDDDDRDNLYCYLGGGKVEQCSITNAVAWYAAEEVCRMFDR